MRDKITAIAFVLFLFTNLCICQNYIWNFTSARGVASHIFLFPNNRGWIYCGDYAYRTFNSGEQWSNPVIMNPQVGGNFNRDVFFVDTLIGWSCYDNILRKTTDGGISWFDAYTFYDIHINTICFPNKNTGWIGGYYSNCVLYKTTNGGINWFKQYPNYYYSINKIKMFDVNKGVICGSSDTIGYTSDGGTTWSGIKIGNGQPVSKIYFLDSLNGWAMGNWNYCCKTTNGGLNWVSLPNNMLSGYSIYFSNLNTGWIGDGYKLWKTTNGGINWSINFQQYYGSYLDDSKIFQILFKNATTGFILYGSGTVFKTTNGGNNWNNCINTPFGELISLKFINENTGYMISNISIYNYSSFFWKTTNGGTNWLITDTSNHTFNSLSMLNTNTGFVCGYLSGTLGSIVKKTINGGTSWDSTKFNNILLNSIYFANDNFGWCGGKYGYICNTSNGGYNWTTNKISTKHINDVWFTDSQNGFLAMDSSTIMKTTNNGLNWSIFNNFNEMYNFKSLFFTNSNTGYVIGNKEVNLYIGSCAIRVVIKTTNAGNNWNLAFRDSIWYYVNIFNKVFFLNDSVGWIVCNEGKIKKTINGGTNWSNDLSGNQRKLFSIQFLNQNIGWAVGEKGTIYSTGQNTRINQIENRIPLKSNLFQNYPNPFNPSTNIRYQIKQNVIVTLKIYDILGKEIETLVNEKQSPGTYEVTWSGNNYTSGVYFYKLITNDFTETKKMMLLK